MTFTNNANAMIKSKLDRIYVSLYKANIRANSDASFFAPVLWFSLVQMMYLLMVVVVSCKIVSYNFQELLSIASFWGVLIFIILLNFVYVRKTGNQLIERYSHQTIFEEKRDWRRVIVFFIFTLVLNGVVLYLGLN
jgi:hypothetical protein